MTEPKALARILALLEVFPVEIRQRIALAVLSWCGGATEVIRAYERARRSRSRHVPDINTNGVPDITSLAVPDIIGRDVPDNTTVDVPDNVPDTHVVKYSPAFSCFWSKYPKRVGKGEAFRSWKRQGLETKATPILEAIEHQRAFLEREDSKFCPNPATWLNQNRWDDEPPNQHESSTLLTPRTARNAAAAREFLKGFRR